MKISISFSLKKILRKAPPDDGVLFEITSVHVKSHKPQRYKCSDKPIATYQNSTL